MSSPSIGCISVCASLSLSRRRPFPLPQKKSFRVAMDSFSSSSLFSPQLRLPVGLSSKASGRARLIPSLLSYAELHFLEYVYGLHYLFSELAASAMVGQFTVRHVALSCFSLSPFPSLLLARYVYKIDEQACPL